MMQAQTALGVAGAVSVGMILLGLWGLMSGDGGLQRMTTLSGIYAVCRPSGYEVVCFAEKGGTGLQCLPLAQAGGVCK